MSGEPFTSPHPIVFSYSVDPASKRDFMQISTSEGERQQYYAPGEGGILGMGANAIVHHCELRCVRKRGPCGSRAPPHPPSPSVAGHMAEIDEVADSEHWDAAVKRQFSLPKMLAFIENKNEAGMAKRLRMAGQLNQGRLLHFYGLGMLCYAMPYYVILHYAILCHTGYCTSTG